jgi:hypothetical protein
MPEQHRQPDAKTRVVKRSYNDRRGSAVCGGSPEAQPRRVGTLSLPAEPVKMEPAGTHQPRALWPWPWRSPLQRGDLTFVRALQGCAGRKASSFPFSRSQHEPGPSASVAACSVHEIVECRVSLNISLNISFTACAPDSKADWLAGATTQWAKMDGRTESTVRSTPSRFKDVLPTTQASSLSPAPVLRHRLQEKSGPVAATASID